MHDVRRKSGHHAPWSTRYLKVMNSANTSSIHHLSALDNVGVAISTIFNAIRLGYCVNQPCLVVLLWLGVCAPALSKMYPFAAICR